MIHHASKVQVYSSVGIGWNITAIISQQKAQSGIKVLIPVCISASTCVRFLHRQISSRISKMIIIDVNLRACKQICIPQAEQKPRIDLQTTIPILAGSIASYIIFIGGIAYPIIIFLSILITELAKNTETVILKEQLWFHKQVNATIEYKSYSHRKHRTF